MSDVVETNPGAQRDGGILSWFLETFRIWRPGWQSATITKGETVLWRHSGTEVRSMPAAWVAETMVRGDADGARATGIRRLESYVFGANSFHAPLAAGGTISVTPVHERLWRVSLCLLFDPKMEGVPVPTHPKVRITRQAGREIVVGRFHGYPTRDAMARRRAELASDLRGSGWRCTSDWCLRAAGPLGLNLPIRRTDVAITLVGDSGSERPSSCLSERA